MPPIHPSGSSRTIVVGDVHGELAILDRLLDAVAPAQADELILVGDLMDRGPASRGVIERAMGLGTACSVTYVRGNHEAMLLAARTDRRCLAWLNQGGLEAMDSYVPGVAEACRPHMAGVFAHRHEFPIEPFLAAVPESHWRFIESSVLWLRRAGFFISHAGVEPAAARPEDSRERVLIEGHPAFPRDYTGAEPVVFGHVFSGRLRGDGKALPYLSPRGNAIGIDVGSYRSGAIAAFVLEENRFLIADRTSVTVIARDEVTVDGV